MNAPFFALIVPMEAPPSGGQPPGIWGPSDGRPTNPIAGWNPGTGQFPPYQPPYPSHPIYGNFPQHPIHYPPGTRPPGQGGPMPPQPGQPPGIWGPNDPRPTNPIAGWDPSTGTFPPGQGPGGGQPPGIWGPNDPRPTLPIAGWNPGTGQFPEGPGSGGEPQQKFERKVGWTEQTGWVVVFVPAEGTLVPTPSTESTGTAPVDTAAM